MELKWPVAYHDEKVSVPLTSHLASVARCALELFSLEIEVLERRHGMSGLRDVLALAAALHDLGKASRAYHPSSRSLQRVTKVSFRYHEFLSGFIVYQAASHDEMKQRIPFWLAAKIIARHHAPMEGRHPVDFLPGSEPSDFDVGEAIGDISDNLRKLDEKEVVGVIDGVTAELSSLATEWFRSAMENVKRQAPHIIREARGAGIERKVKEVIKGLAKVRTEERNYYPIISSLTGMLMVCDNIVAHYERRASDDGASRGYVAHWQNELRRRMELSSFLKELKRHVPEPDAPALP